jgi:superfamily I DNA/RNA helicase
MGFSSWNDVKEYAAEEGSDLKVLVDMVDRYGVDGIIRVAEQAISEEYADHVVTTAHKAKGREWRSVRLADDFREPVDPDTGERTINRAEFQLLYVSVTRAKQALDCTSVNWVDDWLPRDPEPVHGDLIKRAREKRHAAHT